MTGMCRASRRSFSDMLVLWALNSRRLLGFCAPTPPVLDAYLVHVLYPR